MKKIILSLAVVAMFGFASCSKEKTCECTITAAGITAAATEVVIEDGDCSDMDVSTSVAGIESKTVCVEK